MGSSAKTVVVAVLSSAITAMVMHSLQVDQIRPVAQAPPHSFRPSMATVDAPALPLLPMLAPSPLYSPPATVASIPHVPAASSLPPSRPPPSPPPAVPVAPSIQPQVQPAAGGGGGVPPSLDGLATKWDCRRMGAYGDICTYENLCHDGAAYFFLAPGGCGADQLANCPVFYEDADLKEGLIHPSYPVKRVGPHTRFPFNGGALIGHIVDPSVLASPALTVTWSDRVLWRLPLHFPIDNIWFLSSRAMPLYKARRMNASGLFEPPLPPLDAVYIPHSNSSFKGEWTQAFLAVASGGAPVVFKDVWNGGVGEGKWVCMRRVVLTGTFPATVPDMETGFMFRHDMYAYMNMKMPSKPPNKVLFWFRTPPLYRSLINTDEVLEVAHRYNMSYSLITSFPHSFKAQLELFSTHGVIVSPHGAGLVNELFFVPGSGVVEIHPYNFHHNLYPMLAANMGLGHYPVHTYNGTDMWTRYPLYFERKCEDMVGVAVNYIDGDCRDGSTNYRIHVPMHEFEAALVNAMEHAGYRTYYKGVKPHKDPATETGWA